MVIVKIRTSSGGWRTATTRVCRKCATDKPLTEYHRAKGYKYGRKAVCKLCTREYHITWREENRERIAETKRKWYNANRERKTETNRKWNNANRERIAETNRKWKNANKEKVKAKDHKRRALKLSAEGSFTGEEFRQLCETYENKCLCCGRNDVKLTADHVMPLSKGGSNAITNIQPLCGSCNSSKGTKIIDYRKVAA